jgi:hypothetical protein
MASKRNTIHKVGKPTTEGHVRVSNDLVRQTVASLGERGANAFAVLVFLMSHEHGWQTSLADISTAFKWGSNCNRARLAFDALIADRRLIIRQYVRAGGGNRHQDYFIRADGGQFADDEIEKYSTPIELPGGRGSRRPRAER